MKRFFNFALVLLTAAGLASCQRFEDEAILPDAYSVIVNTVETKTANDGYNTVWSSGDEMTMFWKSSQGSPHNGKFTYVSDNKFKTTADVGTSDYRWYGVYPYSSSNTSYTSVSASISETQTQAGNGSMAHLAGSGFPLWGRTDDYVPNKQTPQFTAHQVATVLKFDVKNGDDKAIVVNKIVFTAPTAIAGNCKADLTATTVAWTPASSGTSNSVTLNVTGGAAINKGENAAFFVGAIPFSKNGQYSVTVYATADGKNFESTTTANGNFVADAGTINTVPVTFVGKEVTSKTYTKTTSFTSGKKYVIVYDGHALQNNNGSPAAYSVSASGNTLALASDLASSLEWTATSVSTYTGSGHYSLTNNGKYAARTDDGNNGFEFQTSAVQKAVWDLDNEGNDLYHKNSDGRYTFYLTYSSSKWSVNSRDASNKIAVYVEGGSSDDPTDPPVPDEKCYVKVTSAPADWSGTYLVVDENAKKAFAYNVSSSYATNVTISDGKIAYSSEYDNIALRVTDAGLDHPNTQVATDLGSGTLRAYNVKTKGGQYIYASQSAVKVADSNSKSDGSTTYYHTFFYDNGVYMVSSGNYGPSSGSRDYYYTLAYSSSKFAYGQGKTKLAKVQLYKLSEGGDEPATKQEQNLSFTKSSKTINSDTFTLGNGTYIAPTLIGAMTTPVTWTSSKTSVATVSNNGTVTIVAAGTTTITASAPASDTYNEASASYELTVSPAQGQPTTKTYTKVSTITAGRNYVIAHSNNALQNNDGSAKAFSISGKVSNNTLTLTASEASSLEWKASASSSNRGKFKFANGGTYAYRESSTNVIKLSASAEEDRSAWTLSGTQLYNINSTGSNYYLNLSGTQWQATTGGSSAAITVYEENDGSTPDTPSEPTPDGTTFNLENSTLKTYLDAAERDYSNSTSKSIMSSYLGSGNSRDLPNPVSLKWSGSATSVSIYEGNSTSGTHVKTMSFNSSTSADVYNLIPGKTYTYSTSNGQTGTFTTKGRRRMIKVSDEVSQNHARNCRDLGGVTTRKGETLNYGLMYRGTNMDDVGEPGYEAEKNILLNELGIKLDQDLRGSSKSPIGVAISGEKYDARTIQNQDEDNMTKTVSDVMNAVINGDPVYIHCQIGSDRTGHMCMLYLALLGCELKECDIDYEITSFASGIVYGTRTIGSGNEDSFRSKFIDNPIDNQTFDANHVPEAVERYVTKVLGIDIQTVKNFRSAMGVSNTLN